MGRFLKELVQRVTQKKETDINSLEGADEERPLMRPPTATQKNLRDGADLDDPRTVWFLNITDACQAKHESQARVALIREHIGKWQQTYQDHVANAENVRVFDWREDDKKIKSYIASLEHDLKHALRWAEKHEADYVALKAQENELFAGVRPTLPEDEDEGVAQGSTRKPLDLDA